MRSLGVCYYPEHWPEEIWAEDAARMADAGISRVRIGEFAWSRLEPFPGEWRFEWLDRAIEVLANAGLGVILGTPTATPPRWMLDRHPDMLARDAAGQPRRFGSRRHYCFSHAGYRHEAERVTARLAERYGRHQALVAWQTDNEYGCHDTVLSYSDAARDGFRRWLAERYGDIGQLNAAWGNVFWSMEYQRFDQIDLPNLTVTAPNPAHVMAFRRYSSEMVRVFNAAQVALIKAQSDAPILHNYMGRVLEFDHFDVGADLDIASWDSYPIGFLSDRIAADDPHKQRYLRQGDPDFQAFHHDLYRAVGRGRWWVMEQQPGPVNWAPWNAVPLPGMVRLWSWEAFAHGAETVAYFRWRQAPFAQEQMHAGLLRPDNAPAPALEEVATLSRELAELPAASSSPASVALIIDYPSAWAWEIEPQGADFSYFDLVFDWYRSARELGLSLDIVDAKSGAIGDYALVLIPGLAAWPPALLEALKEYEGQALIGPRSGAKTAEAAIPVPLPPAIPGLAVTVAAVDSMPPGTEAPLAQGGAITRWLEHLDTPLEAQERLEDGRPLCVGAGGLTYVGGWPDAVARRRMVKQACARAGIETEDLPDGLRLRDLGPLRFALNYGPEPVRWRGNMLEPAGMMWWET